VSGVLGLFFDGRASAATAVEINVETGNTLVVQGNGVDLRYSLAKVRIAPRIGNAARTIGLPGGAACEVRDNDALDRLLSAPASGSRLHHVIYLLESRPPLVMAVLVLTVLVGWASIEHGIPYVVRVIAYSLPRDVDEKLGEGALEGLDAFFLERSRVDRGIRPRLRARFAALADAAMMDGRVRLEFRASPAFGANALALPSGIVVLTDELVELAQNDQELLAILAHELGHIQNRHTLRSWLQNSITPLLIATVIGDLSSISALAGTLPTFLIDMKYSRAFEREADDFAVELLDREGIPPRHLADILDRITSGEPDDEGLGHYLSTHPAIRERIERIHGR
jgi:Zn-dependent protease with chaperone function